MERGGKDHRCITINIVAFNQEPITELHVFACPSLSINVVVPSFTRPARAGLVVMTGFDRRRRWPTWWWVIRLRRRQCVPWRRIGIFDRARTVLYIRRHSSVPVSVLLLVQAIVVVIISVPPASSGVIVLVGMPRIGRWTDIPLISDCRLSTMTCALVQHNVLVLAGLGIDGVVLCVVCSLSNTITPQDESKVALEQVKRQINQDAKRGSSGDHSPGQ